MEKEISEKIQRLTGILLEEANKFPRLTVSQYSTGVYGYDWKVYLDEEHSLAPSPLPPRFLSPSPNSGAHSGTS